MSPTTNVGGAATGHHSGATRGHRDAPMSWRAPPNPSPRPSRCSLRWRRCSSGRPSSGGRAPHVAPAKEPPEGMGAEFRRARSRRSEELAHRTEAVSAPRSVPRRGSTIRDPCRAGVSQLGRLLPGGRLGKRIHLGRCLAGAAGVSRHTAAVLVLVGLVAVLWRLINEFGWTKMLDQRDRDWRRGKADGETKFVAPSVEVDEILDHQEAARAQPTARTAAV